jgi:hypothetical protein
MYELDSIEYLDENGEITKEIILREDRRTPDEVVLRNQPESGSTTTKSFRPDGTLEKIVVTNDAGEKVSSEEHSPAENIREPIDEELLKSRAFEDPPRTNPEARSMFIDEGQD